MTAMNGTKSGVATALLLLRVACGGRAECWDTGCQPDSWLVRGCEQYDGMTELKREPCDGRGHVYSCCYQKNSVDPSRPLCRAITTDDGEAASSTGGCPGERHAIQAERRPCCADPQHGVARGHAYFCCENPLGNLTSDAFRVGYMTHYSLGLTACGRVYADGDMVAAVAFDLFTSLNPNTDPLCGTRATVVDPTTLKRVDVTIVDKCEACKTDDIDLSPAAFEKLRPKIVGRTKVVWQFV